MERIPKILHYCWFGKTEKPDHICNYIQTWKTVLPDYQIVEWNESNFEIENEIPYVQEAYRVKKYAFVSDYARLCALRDYGGIYLDTDVEVVKPFEELLNSGLVLGFEMKDLVCTAFIASEKGNVIIKDLIDTYRTRRFIKDDGTFDTKTINQGLSEQLRKNGIRLDECALIGQDDILIYPIDYFSAQDIMNSHPLITENTRTVHWFQGSWTKSPSLKQKLKFKVIVPILQRILGYKKYDEFNQWKNRTLRKND